MVKLEHLRYFIAAAEKRSFHSASRALFISSTSIVHAVKQLEDHYGICLFIRKKSVGLTLTSDGKKLLKMAQSLLNEVDIIDDAFSNSKDGLKGELVVGCQEGLTWSLLPRVIGILEKKHPNLEVIMKTTWMEERFAPLENGEIDVLVTFLVNEVAPKTLDTTLLCRPQICALMRKGHPLDNESNGVNLRDLANYPQVMINDGDGYSLFYNMYKDLGFEPKVKLMSNISTGAQSIVGRTDAVSLRIIRPVNKLSPLGDAIVSPKIADNVIGPDLVVLTNKMRTYSRDTKQGVFIKEVERIFASGEMKKHIYY